MWVLQCLEYLNNLTASIKKLHGVELERRVTLAKFGLPMIWGTADVIVTDHFTKTVHVIDWKFVKSSIVSAERNPQGMCYMLGAAAEYDYNTFIFHVAQPPLDNFDSYTIEKEKLLQYAEDVLKLAVVEATKDQPIYRPSLSACKWCIAEVDCAARVKMSLATANLLFSTESKLPAVASIEDITELLAQEKMIKDHLRSIRSWASGKLKRGDKVPGFKLVQGNISRAYTDEDKVIEYCVSELGIDPEKLFEVKLKSPNKLEIYKPTLKKNKTFQDMIARIPGSVSMVEESSKRKAYTPLHEALSAFADDIIEEKG
jgi:hypothetical protein